MPSEETLRLDEIHGRHDLKVYYQFDIASIAYQLMLAIKVGDDVYVGELHWRKAPEDRVGEPMTPTLTMDGPAWQAFKEQLFPEMDPEGMKQERDNAQREVARLRQELKDAQALHFNDIRDIALGRHDVIDAIARRALELTGLSTDHPKGRGYFQKTCACKEYPCEHTTVSHVPPTPDHSYTPDAREACHVCWQEGNYSKAGD